MPPSDGLERAVDVIELGFEMMRRRFEREHPGASEAEIRQMMREEVERLQPRHWEGPFREIPWPRPTTSGSR